VAVGARLGKAEGRLGPPVCAGDAPCQTVTTTELILRGDGAQERVGETPSPLCEACPLREERNRPVRWVEVVRDLRNRHGGRDHESATRRATLPAARFDGAREGHGSPEPSNAPTPPTPEGDCLPPAWGPDHPARLAAKGLEPPERPRRSFAGHEGTPGLRPEDFGL